MVETGLPGENHRPAASQYKLYPILFYRVQLAVQSHVPTMVMTMHIISDLKRGLKSSLNIGIKGMLCSLFVCFNIE